MASEATRDSPLRVALQARAEELEGEEQRRKPGSTRLRSLEDRLEAALASEASASDGVQDAVEVLERATTKRVTVEKQLADVREELAVAAGATPRIPAEVLALNGIEERLANIQNSACVPEAATQLAELSQHVASLKSVAEGRAVAGPPVQSLSPPTPARATSRSSALSPGPSASPKGAGHAAGADQPATCPVPFLGRAMKLKVRLRGKTKLPLVRVEAPAKVRRKPKPKAEPVTATEVADRKAEIAERRRALATRARACIGHARAGQPPRRPMELDPDADDADEL